jgi:ferrochelatase
LFSGSSLTAWREAAAAAGLAVPTTALCCYHADAGYLAAAAAGVRAGHAAATAALPPGTKLRVLFSAHGLPKAIVDAGDPYVSHIESTVAGILARWQGEAPDWAICYQSRATPQQWIEPSTEAEIERAAHDRAAVLVVPVAFVSEHSETLVELDVEYRALAERLGVPGYFRVPTQNADAGFIAALADLARRALAAGPGLRSFAGARTCASGSAGCPQRIATAEAAG